MRRDEAVRAVAEVLASTDPLIDAYLDRRGPNRFYEVGQRERGRLSAHAVRLVEALEAGGYHLVSCGE